VVSFIRFRPNQHRQGEGVSAVPLIGEARGSRSLSGGITRFPPGTSVRAHSHSTEEVLAVLQGKALIEVGEKRIEAEPFDVCYLPAGEVHRVKNSGDSDLLLAWIYGATTPVRILAGNGTTE